MERKSSNNCNDSGTNLTVGGLKEILEEAVSKSGYSDIKIVRATDVSVETKPKPDESKQRK